jgi:uncharacterized DUF497 family protein
MACEWDEAKRLSNIEDHDIDFVDAQEIFDSDILIVEDDRFDYGERRFIAFALMNGTVIAVAYTERGDNIRIISARKATPREEKRYFEEIWN